MLPERYTAVFEALYRTDLVDQPASWKLCEDAHCCSFGRHKARFRLISKGGGQDLPLFPGEFEFLQAKVLRGRLVDHAVLKPELAALQAFSAHYGTRFTDELSALQAPRTATAA